MNRQLAQKLAEQVTIEDLQVMFLNARTNITNWQKRSRVNKGMTVGTTFNILSNGMETATKKPLDVSVTNMIWEFGEFLPNYKKMLPKKPKRSPPHHQEPREFTLQLNQTIDKHETNPNKEALS